MEPDGLNIFHPLIAKWFRAKVGRPTDVQTLAWPRIASGSHLLVSAPTGSGKTLTAFLWALNQLIQGGWPLGRTRVLYVSPLKALNNDVRRNLLTPLSQLKEEFASAGETLPDIKVLTRSGDTPQSQRRQMLRHPPEILITTPESLNLLLSSQGGAGLLTGLKTVILDEVHAVLGGKRDVHLMSAVERLTLLSGEFQRLALSATVKPLDLVARLVGGYEMQGRPPTPQYAPRKVEVITTPHGKEHEITVRFPPEGVELPQGESIWAPLVEQLKESIRANRSTLIFVNSRRLAEKVTHLINQGEAEPLAYAHHGSLSKEIRREVERRLKAGELRAIVATSSLELGIDIGALEEVLLVQSPPAVSAAIQRLGRAGHQVGQVSRGRFQPSHSHDILEAAVLARAVMDGDLEEVKPVRGSLDVLAQVLVSMLCTREWNLDELYARVRCAWCFHKLSRRQFDLVIDMLAGRYAETRVRELKARISVDRLAGTARIVKGAQMALFLSGGTIPDRGYFHLRTMNGAARLGDLDEEFVWEARVGDVFTMGAQNWRIDRITHDDVLVSPGRSGRLAPPFWKAELSGRDHHLSTRLAEFLEEAEERFNEPGFWEELSRRYFLDDAALAGLKKLLGGQREVTGRPLPHRHHLLVELVQAGPQGGPGYQAVLHTVWGGRVNRPYALALQAAWEERFGARLEIFAANDCIYLILPHEMEAGELLSLVGGARLEDLLRRRLEGSGIFGAQFRECAGRALLLSRRKFNERMPLWLNRLRGKKLLGAVQGYGDFPIMLEAWRACLHDEFDLDALKMHLAELESGAIQVSQARTGRMSPLAQTMAWRLTNLYMYEDDTPEGMGKTGLSEDLLSEAVFNPGLRPKLEPEVVRGFLAKRQRLQSGYAPESPDELWDWLVERQALPLAEWENLLKAMERDSGLRPSELEAELGSRLVRLIPPRAHEPLIAARQETPRLLEAWRQAGENCTVAPLMEGARPPQARLPEPGQTEAALENFLGQWLSFYGPLNPRAVSDALGMGLEQLEPALEGLSEAKSLITGELVAGVGGTQVCDAQNFEICLRLARAQARPAFEPLALRWLPVWLAQRQGLLGAGEAEDALAPALERLVCLSATAGAWEEDILPARAKGYRRVWLDRILAENDLLWLGHGKQKVLFCFGDDLDLLPGGEDPPEPDPASLFPDPQARYDLTTLMENSGLGPARIVRRLWQGVWAGRVSNTSFAALRQGIENRFLPPKLEAAPFPRRGARPRLRRFKAGLPLAGDWHLVPNTAPAGDPLEEDERARERARILLERYGVVFRELLKKEAPGFNWREVFRSLRLMELSGEVMAGYFFEGVPGPQFVLPQILPQLNRIKRDGGAIFWLAASDPASACGLGLEGLRGILPRRAAGTHLAFRGAELVLVSLRRGKELRILAPPDDPDLSGILAPVRHLVSRRVNPVRGLRLEIINGRPAARSPYLEALKASFSITLDHKGIMLYPLQP